MGPVGSVVSELQLAKIVVVDITPKHHNLKNPQTKHDNATSAHNARAHFSLCFSLSLSLSEKKLLTCVVFDEIQACMSLASTRCLGTAICDAPSACVAHKLQRARRSVCIFSVCGQIVSSPIISHAV